MEQILASLRLEPNSSPLPLIFEARCGDKFPLASYMQVFRALCLEGASGKVGMQNFGVQSFASRQNSMAQNSMGLNSVGQNGLPPPPIDATLLSEISSIKTLLVNGLTEMKSAELDRRASSAKMETEQKLMELERKFNRQLNEARRKNELLIADLKNNYEAELGQLRSQKVELQRNLMLVQAEADRLGQLLVTSESEKALRTNFANVINRQSEMVLQFLRGNEVNRGELDKLTAQAGAMLRNVAG